jgi:acyl carrier protein
MDVSEIRKIARDVVSDVLEIDHNGLADDASFYELGADSVQRLEVVALLRVRLGIRYELAEESRMNSIDDVISITQARLHR